MKKILYGTSYFPGLIRENGYFVDKTRYIKELEKLGSKYLMFLRPRRFGKSMLISMLEAYYDINTADQFDELFGNLYIGKHPTKLRNSYPILRFNFSRIRGDAKLEDIEMAFNLNIMSSIETFYVKYPAQTGGIEVFEKDLKHLEKANIILDRFLEKMKQNQLSFFLLIDEYDNFANNILADHGRDVYHKVTHGTGFLRAFFTTIKAGTDSQTVARMFTTGVSPLVMSDVTSGFNMGSNLSQEAIFNEMIGLTQEEVETAVDYYIAHKMVPAAERELVLEAMKKHYDGYLFSLDASKSVYNTNSVMYLLDQYCKNQKMPEVIVDNNMITDYHKLRFLVTKGKQAKTNLQTLTTVLEKNRVGGRLIRDFSVDDLLEQNKFISFMYYLGFLTIAEKSVFNYIFIVPNEMCKTILWEYIRKTIQDIYSVNLLELQNKLETMILEGLWEPFFRHTFDEFYKAVSIRDFIFREEGVRSFLLAYLSLSDIFDVYSEPELNKGYADLYVKPRLGGPFTISTNEYLIELKHIKQADIKPKTKQKLIDSTIEQAKVQLEQYAQDSKVSPHVIKIIAITSTNELLYLSKI